MASMLWWQIKVAKTPRCWAAVRALSASHSARFTITGMAFTRRCERAWRALAQVYSNAQFRSFCMIPVVLSQTMRGST